MSDTKPITILLALFSVCLLPASPATVAQAPPPDDPGGTPAAERTLTLRGEIVDSADGSALAARVYLRSESGRWYFPRSASSEGSAVEYRKQRFDRSLEMHTTLSAHPFEVKLPPGRYTLSVRRGKEYLPRDETFELAEDTTRTIRLRRWIDMASRGWYSGDTHVHRTLDELPNVMLAEDLNVALPLSYWVTQSHRSPTRGDKNTGGDLVARPIPVDPTHLIYPMNTEYEIFTVGDRRHTLGAVFVLGHRSPLEMGAPPVEPIATETRRQGALLDLDKHSWPWSLMLVPVMQVDLFELSNNHVWRTEFGFRNWTEETVPEHMNIERDERGLTERGWIDFGFRTYYSLLNCGFRMRPTAGTASGVHPVPLGFGRVYVHLPDGFGYEAWMRGLDRGRSFVTTGPMLLDVTIDGRPMGATLTRERPGNVRVRGTARSAVPLKTVELVVNGEVVRSSVPDNERDPRGGYRSEFDETLPLEGSSWVVVRAFEDRADGRVRFAHGSPVHVDVNGQPLRPRRVEVEYLVRRMEQELERNRDVLSEVELDEYRRALGVYRRIAETAR